MFVKVVTNAIGGEFKSTQVDLYECKRYRLHDDPKDESFVQLHMEVPELSIGLPKAPTEIFAMSDIGKTVDRHTWYGHRARASDAKDQGQDSDERFTDESNRRIQKEIDRGLLRTAQ